eukprot:scaffold156800_cov28-Tisochrysis_lutea.AAC.1
MEGEMDMHSRLTMSGSRASSRNSSSSCWENSVSDSPSAVRISKPWRTPRTCRYGVRMATLASALPVPALCVMMDMIPVTWTRSPGCARSTSRRSTVSMMERGISPVGTCSGAS